MALRRYRGHRGRRRALIPACRKNVRAVAGPEGCDMALRRTEDVADDGERGYRRAERTYAPWQGRRDAIWLYASTEDVADDGEGIQRKGGGMRYGSTPVRRTPRTTETMDTGAQRGRTRRGRGGGMRYGSTPVR